MSSLDEFGWMDDFNLCDESYYDADSPKIK